MRTAVILSCLASSAMAFSGQVLPSLRSAARVSISSAHRTVMSSASGFEGRRKSIGLCTAAAFSVATGAFVGVESATAATDAETMTISTTAGDMEFEFWSDVAPKTVENFKSLAKTGYFDGQAFHRIIKGFVIQGGDPNSKVGYGPKGTLEGADASAVRKWGTGGPGYNINAEFNARKHEFGVLSMARSNDPNSAGSQFFVCLGPLASLDNKYTTFGKMTKGEEVLKAIGTTKTVRGDYPFSRQGIEKVTINPAK